jgi:hypothetical protein
MVETYDALYSVFGAVDFVDPWEVLPAAAAALRPGGPMVRVSCRVRGRVDAPLGPTTRGGAAVMV